MEAAHPVSVAMATSQADVCARLLLLVLSGLVLVAWLAVSSTIFTLIIHKTIFGEYLAI